MERNILLILGICIILIGVMFSIIIYNGGSYMEDKQIESKVYQGPVPEGYNEEHFRKTGETILIK